MTDDTPHSPPPVAARAKSVVPLWRRLAVGTVQLGGAVFALFHLYALALSILPAPGTLLMIQRAGQGEKVRQDWVSLDKISPNLVLAVISAEDAKFCAHDGIDWDAIGKAREYNRKHDGTKRRGGSTISQQTAKNVFFWNGGGMVRKAGEAWMTYVIEAVWGKRRIMEVYLNVAEWGDGLFGAEAAAQARFGKSAADLTPLEAARLAAVLPSPNKWSADKPGPYVRKRTGSIQSRMRVVANEGYAACVLGDDFRSNLPKPEPGETPRPPPVLEDLPDAPESGDEGLAAPAEAPVPDENANDALNDLLDSADETFNPAPDPVPDPVPETDPPPEPTPDPPSDESGPTILTPK
ncbi:MAG: monofunctional biosynthetic peptidoglycan transglycosylase [Hyphomonas sp.]|uniref:monofunctional biosynthetic peptidoglycan transglycosylase n=1 Tax=Hyphomonas sp. TaxID=87 RepID=UPI0018538713|nr:monofunctional biosynthetic peptidoglycan transglycosylase [Hyphomonas sp.]MBA3068674.1 monofunctional biosynthetic peptidoglycan transglycosylase [Hyphomonas sp.]MBU3922091.1 monofunctional biosynthetic peptidoglycan transglycosylase [Alphaproteobacteria bacterium]MBU4063663.1 monofunctional biosynthetic peptidoglycan transglycosylase [Alphaproteobacteria bacterium]MBU4165712.1 monofunctional biosynthetic peptidoglycan transglycosylase [Alphaproteobacteria bacterium]